MSKILLITYSELETKTVMDVFARATGRLSERKMGNGNVVYYRLGEVGGADVYLAQSEMGGIVLGGTVQTITNGIKNLLPVAVISVGAASGTKPETQSIGDILVSKQLNLYEPQHVTLSGQIPRGDRVTCRPELLGKFRSGTLDWESAQVHFGLILSGEKEIADANYRDQLLRYEPEAIGIDVGGNGLYNAASEQKVDWIVVKAITDWADGEKDDTVYAQAIRNVAEFVRHVVELGGWTKETVDASGGVYSYPPLDTKNIVGRDKEIAQIVDFVEGRSGHEKSFLDIRGTPGIGKSTVAALACTKLQSRYRVLWIDCTKYESLDSLMPDIAKVTTPRIQTISDLQERLKTDHLLVVFDRADTLWGKVESKLLPGLEKFLGRVSTQSSGRVMLTTGQSVDSRHEPLFEIDPLASEDAYQLFLQWWGVDDRQFNDRQKQDVRALCKEFTGYIPQSIEWMGIFAKGQSIRSPQTLRNALTRFSIVPEQRTRHAALGIICQQMLQDGHGEVISSALSLLVRMVLMAPVLSFESIECAASASPPIHEYRRARALDKLIQLRLVVRANTHQDSTNRAEYQVPLNVREYIRDRYILDNEAWAGHINQIKPAVALCLLQSPLRIGWDTGLEYLFEASRWKQVLFWAKERFNISENASVFPPGDSELLEARAHWAMAYRNYQRRDYRKALKLANQGYQMLGEHGGVNSYSLTLRFNNIRAICSHQLRSPDIESALAESQRIINQAQRLGVSNALAPEVAQFYFAHGVYESEKEGGDLSQALVYIQKSLDISTQLMSEMQLQEQNDLYVKGLANMAAILSQMAEQRKHDGKESEAIEYGNKSIDYSKKIIERNPAPYYVASEYANLVLTYYTMGKLDEAYAMAIEGDEYCRRYGQNEARLSLLLTAMDVDIAREDTVQARGRIPIIHRLANAIGEGDTDETAILTAWSKVHCLEASAPTLSPKERRKKVEEAREYYDQARDQARKTGNQEDEEIVRDLEEFLKHKGCL